MKKIIYRLIFKFNDSKDKSVNRDNRISSVLSDDNVIDTETQIKKPEIGSIIVIEDEDYKVSSIKQAYTTDEENVYNTTIVLLDKITKNTTTTKTNVDIKEILRLRDEYIKRKLGKDDNDYNDWIMTR